MEAADIIVRVCRAIERHRLDAVMIGNAGAALHGAPVTTVDIDFLTRDTAVNRRKASAIAADLGATLYRPIYPACRMLRMMDDQTLEVDFMDESIAGAFGPVHARSVCMPVRGVSVRVAALSDILEMKRAANRPKDRAVLDILEMALHGADPGPAEGLTTLAAVSEWLRIDMVRRRVASPIEWRTNFLRRRVGICSTAL